MTGSLFDDLHSPPPLSVPFQGSSPVSADCSRAGAVHAAETAGTQALQLLALYRQHGPLTDAEAAHLMGVDRCAINARRASLIKMELVDRKPKGTKRNAVTGVMNSMWGVA